MKSKVTIMPLVIWGLLCLAAGCDYPAGAEVVSSIRMEDKGGSGFSFLVSYTYPDTLIPSNYNELSGCPSHSIVRYDSKKNWKDVFKDLQSDTLSIFIFEEVVSEANWNDVRSDYRIAQRYDLSLQDLKKLDYSITFPPDSRMQGIKMYSK